MKIAFFDTKPYDRTWFDPLFEDSGYKVKYFESKLSPDTASLATGYDAVCVFVNDDVSAETIDRLCDGGVGLIALRCSGYNNVDLKAAKGRLKVARVPKYSPDAVAEYAMALLLTVNRKTHRAYIRTRDNNFNINGLCGTDLKGKTAGIIGTGQIGSLFCDICKGFKMNVIAYDAYKNPRFPYEYVGLRELFERSDVISLHCPLNFDTRHIVSENAISVMKKGCFIINTSRGGLIDTTALIDGLKSGVVGGAGLDVYEEEEDYFFEDLSNEIPKDDELSRLLSFPNVVVTSHQGFFTREAMQSIAQITLGNFSDYEKGELENEITC